MPVSHCHLESKVNAGLELASQAFSTMIGMKAQLSSSGWRHIPLADIPTLCGGAEAPVVAVYVRFTGDVLGHTVFVFTPEVASFLADAILQERTGEVMQHSALCELCNVASSSILSQLADSVQATILPTPPLLVQDMAGAILEAVAISLTAHGLRALVLETTIAINDRPYAGHFLLVPDQEVDGVRLGVLI